MEDRHGEVMMSHLDRDQQVPENTTLEPDSLSPLITPYPQNESLASDEGEYCIRPNYEAADVDESAEEDSSGFFSNMSPYASCSNRSICNDDRLMKTESGSTLHNETGSFASDVDVADIQNSKSTATTPGSLRDEPIFSTPMSKSHSGQANDCLAIPNNEIFHFDNLCNNTYDNEASNNFEYKDNDNNHDGGKCIKKCCEQEENFDGKINMPDLTVNDYKVKESVLNNDISDVEVMIDKSVIGSEFYDSNEKSTPLKVVDKIFTPLQCNLIKLPSFNTSVSPISTSSVGEASGGRSPGICCDSADQCDRRNSYIFGPARSVHDFGEVDRKFSVNEFGDTIGICEAVNDVFCSGAQVFEGGNLFDRSFSELRGASPENSYSNGESSLVSLNTHLMDILTDLDDVLEKSLMNDSGGEDFEDKNSPLKSIAECDYEENTYDENVVENTSFVRDESPSFALENELCRLSDIKLEIIEPLIDEVPNNEHSSPLVSMSSNDELFFGKVGPPDVSFDVKENGEFDIESGELINDLKSTDKENVANDIIEHAALENKTRPDSIAVENYNTQVQNVSHQRDTESKSLVKLLEPSSLSHGGNFSRVVDVGDVVALNCEYSEADRDKEIANCEETHSEVGIGNNRSTLQDKVTPNKIDVCTVVENRSNDETVPCDVRKKFGFTETNFENELEDQNKETVVSKCKYSPNRTSSLKIDTLPQFALSKMIHTQSAEGDGGNAAQEAEEHNREGTSESGLHVKRVGSRDPSPDPSSVGRLRPNEAVMRERRDSMRLARPLDLPSAPPHSRSTSPDPLTLPVLLFMETHSPEYSPARQINPPSSAPRVYGRRGPTEARLSVSNTNNSDVAASVVVAGVERRDSRRAWRSSGANRTRSSSASSSRAPRSVSSDSSSLSSNETSAAVTPRRSTTCTDTRPQPEEGAGSNGTASSTISSEPLPETEAAKSSEWPHGLSSMLACLGCTIGVFNISRFSILSIHFGANFMVQFLVLSLAIGIPLFLVHVCLGRAAGAGPLAVWKVSPLLRGIGAALLLSQAVIGTYSVVGLTWLFVYFSDSFVTSLDQYRWAEPFRLYREDMTVTYNGTYKLSETIPDYFNGVVLKRHNLASSDNSFGTVKFQLTFNLAVVWMIVFVALSKGLRSYGKVVYVFAFLPICCTLILCAKLLSLTPHDSVYDVFPETSWNEFFINSKSWAAAAQEAFLTWGLLGACAMQLTSHGARRIGPGKPDSSLRRDCLCLVLLTFSILLLAAFLANTCVHILSQHGYIYSPGSFEEMSSYTFLTPRYNPLPSSLGSTPPRHMWHHCNLMGMHVTRPGSDPSAHSGYQLLQLATELVPSTLAIVGPEEVSSFWAVLFYFILILFGVAQQLAIWHCVITGIMAINNRTLQSWETTITFFSCAFGFVLGLPLTTDTGISVIHFMDYVIVGVWWNCLLHVALLCGMFLVRGRPYSGEAVVGMLYSRSSAIGPLLCFTWNVLLPVALIALCVVDFRAGKYRQLYTWRRSVPGLEYWPLWCKRVGATLQLIPLLTVVFIGFIQTCRYLGSGPPDILERIQLLYRPHVDGPGTSPPVRTANNNRGTPRAGEATTDTSRTAETGPDPVLPDPPPKYTPPPSYSTATGARIAKALRHSIRRSIRGVRRLAISFGESSTTLPQIPMSISEAVSQQTTVIPVVNSPPDYSVLLTTQNGDLTTDLPPVNDTYITELNHPADIITRNEEEFVIPDLIPVEQDIASGFDQRFTSLPSARVYQSFNSGSSLQRSQNDSKATTACDVANLLRSSMRRSARIRTLPSSFDGSLSQECLLNQAEPVSNTTVIVINENRESDNNRALSSPRCVARQPNSDLDEDRTSVI